MPPHDRRSLVSIGVALLASPAAADIAIGPQAVFSPFDHAWVTVEWAEPTLRFNGMLRWANPIDPGLSSFGVDLINLRTVTQGTRVVLPELFSSGQELILGYADHNGTLLFTHKEPDKSPPLEIVVVSPTEYQFFAPTLQSPDGPSTEMENAMIIVRFAQLPSPGTVVFIGALGLLAVRRR